MLWNEFDYVFLFKECEKSYLCILWCLLVNQICYHYFFAEQDDREGNQEEEEEEALSFTLASVGEHSINRASESQEALDTHVDATAIVVTPISAAIHSSRNTSAGDRKLDLVV
jgi:hypothetical protein